MTRINFGDCEFVTSAVKASQYPNHHLKEIALVGRSNVGKSSLINALLNRRNLARTSNQPGRTQTINFYRVGPLSLVDLPGYGYAKVSQKTKEQWGSMIENYLNTRENLVGILQLIDIRHKPTEQDVIMAEYLRHLGTPAYAIATKADKLGRGKQRTNAHEIAEALQLPVLIFSASTKQGRDKLTAVIYDLYNNTGE